MVRSIFFLFLKLPIGNIGEDTGVPTLRERGDKVNSLFLTSDMTVKGSLN